MKSKTGEELAKQFRSGDLYVCTGLFGNGIYVAYGVDKYDAEGYMGTETERAILRMTLKPDTKVISIDELENIQSLDPIVQAHPELKNLGCYATFKGYDGIDVGVRKNEPLYIVVLNRTAVRGQNESLVGVE